LTAGATVGQSVGKRQKVHDAIDIEFLQPATWILQSIEDGTSSYFSDAADN